MDWGTNEWLAIGSAAIALLSFMLNGLVVKRQIALQYESLKAQVDAEVLDWAQEAINVLSEAVELARGRGVVFQADEMRRGVSTVSRQLSAMADRGRLFFPNERPETFGQGKEAAFQGFRPPILDAVIFAMCQLESLDDSAAAPDQKAADFLIGCRRLLVSEAQNAIDPRRRASILRQLALGRLDDSKSTHQIVRELVVNLNQRHPGLAQVKYWLEAHKVEIAPAEQSDGAPGASA